MISTDNGKIILMSSHRSMQNNTNFIDIGSLRSSYILSNHINYVCPVHLKEMLSIQKTVNMCLCNIFNHPFHIDNSGSFKSLTEMLSKNKSDKSTNNEDYSMLCELGVDINSIEENEELQTLSDNSLCTKKALILFQTNLMSIKNMIKANQKGTKISDTVMVYIDPAPVPSDKSYNAICFTTRIEYQLNENLTSHKYVLLAVEKFSSFDIDQVTRDYGIATANLLMRDIRNIFVFYEGYFKKFIIAPEADSIAMDRFLVECKQMLHIFETKNSYPKIYFTMMKEPMNKSSQIKAIANFNQQRESRSLPTFQISKSRNKKIKLDTDILCKESDYSSTSLMCTKLRIGYNLGKEKRRVYMEFLMNEFNAHNVSCASEIFSISLAKENISIPTLLADYLGALKIKSSGKITGKGIKNGEFQPDDVSVAVIMSTMLFPHALDKRKFNNIPLYELQNDNRDTSDYETELLRGAEHIITTATNNT